MTNNAFNYFNDGANGQAQAVLAYMSAQCEGIEPSWNEERGEFDANVEVNRFHNCREQGYVVSMRSKDYRRQINIVFAEHRNSDCIFIVEFELGTLNPPTIKDIPNDHPWSKSKYDYDKSFPWGEAEQAARYIIERLEKFWMETVNA